MNDNSQIPTKEEIIKNMAKHLQTHMQDGEEVLLRTYDLAFIKGKMEAMAEMKKGNNNKETANTMIFINSNTPISFALLALSIPSIAFFANLIKSMSNGTITGKLRIAIKVLLLLALEAIAETMVNMLEKLKPPKATANK